MVGCGRGCHLPVQSAVAEYRESLLTQCIMHVIVIAHTTWLGVHLKEGTVPCCSLKEGLSVLASTCHYRSACEGESGEGAREALFEHARAN